MERGETHLRLVAEAELRRAREQDAGVPAGRRVVRIAEALTAVGAIDAATAGAIQDDFELALAGRQRNPQARWPADAPWQPTGWRWMPRAKTGPSAQHGAPGRLVPVGMTIPLRSAESHGELHLLTYVQTAAGAWFTMMAGLYGEPVPRSPRPDLPGRELLSLLAATDEAGRAYSLNFTGGGASGGNGSSEWSGQLRLRPDPPPGLPWLDLVTGPADRATRIHLDPPPPPEVRISPTALAPGEHLLNRLAASLLAGERTRLGPGLLTGAAEELDDIVEALQAVGALPPLSPVPGQLATLYARMNVPGVTAGPAGDLPERWLSVLARQGGHPDPAASQSSAGAAVALPEVDGIKILILGLHRNEHGTVLHLQASAVEPKGGLPLLWLRDDGGHWHTTRPRGTSTRDGEVTMRLLIVPPVHRTAWIEVVAAGASAEARTTLALSWSLTRRPARYLT